jgi:hypothetical protein
MTVQRLAAIACTEQEILDVAHWGQPGNRPISPTTLRKHFARELERGRSLARTRAKQKLSELIDAGNLGAIAFYLKTQAGWRETSAVEVSGKDGAPLPPAQVVFLPVKDARPDAPAAPAAVADRRPPPALALGLSDADAPDAAGAVGPRGVMYPNTADPRR